MVSSPQFQGGCPASQSWSWPDLDCPAEVESASQSHVGSGWRICCWRPRTCSQYQRCSWSCPAPRWGSCRQSRSASCSTCPAASWTSRSRIPAWHFSFFRCRRLKWPTPDWSLVKGHEWLFPKTDSPGQPWAVWICCPWLKAFALGHCHLPSRCQGGRTSWPPGQGWYSNFFYCNARDDLLKIVPVLPLVSCLVLILKLKVSLGVMLRLELLIWTQYSKPLNLRLHNITW